MSRVIGEAPKEDRVPIPAGAYVFTLKEIKDHESEDRWNLNPDGTMPMKKQLIWVFVADKVDPETKKPYEFAQFTGLWYGDDRANMTKLLDWMLPDIDHDTKRRGIDVDALVGRKFKGRIQHVPTEKGGIKPALTMLDPIESEAQSVPQPVAGATAASFTGTFDPDEIPFP